MVRRPSPRPIAAVRSTPEGPLRPFFGTPASIVMAALLAGGRTAITHLGCSPVGGVSPRADLTFSCSELKCASVTVLDAPMRESRDPAVGGRT